MDPSEGSLAFCDSLHHYTVHSTNPTPPPPHTIQDEEIALCFPFSRLGHWCTYSTYIRVHTVLPYNTVPYISDIL